MTGGKLIEERKEWSDARICEFHADRIGTT